MANAWIQHVKEYARKNNISYGCAISEAKASYTKKAKPEPKKKAPKPKPEPKKKAPKPEPKPKPKPEPKPKASPKKAKPKPEPKKKEEPKPAPKEEYINLVKSKSKIKADKIVFKKFGLSKTDIGKIGPTWNKVKKAYRELVRKNHPDKMGTKGTKETQTLNAMYAYLTNRYGKTTATKITAEDIINMA